MIKPINHIKNVIKIHGIPLVLQAVSELCDEFIEENKNEDDELLEIWEHNKWNITKCITDWEDGYESWE